MRSIDEIKADYNDCQNCKTNHDCLSIISNCPKLYNIAHYKHEILRAITDGIPLDELETMCAAWKDGRVVVLPCKVGDTIRVDWSPYGKIVNVDLFEVGKDYVPSPAIDHCEGAFTFEQGEYEVLTREAAEAALKGAEHDD